MAQRAVRGQEEEAYVRRAGRPKDREQGGRGKKVGDGEGKKDNLKKMTPVMQRSEWEGKKEGGRKGRGRRFLCATLQSRRAVFSCPN